VSTRTATDQLRLHAVLWVGAARLGLWILPWGWIRRLAARASVPGSERSQQGISPAAIGEAVRAAPRAVPRATCLVQALAAGILLRRAGLPATLHLGVPGGRRGKFGAHAWVESDGQVVVGGDPSEQHLLASFDLEEDPAWVPQRSLAHETPEP